MTASLAVSKQILHSNVARSRSRSPSPPFPLEPSRSLLFSSDGNPLLAGPPSFESPVSADAITVYHNSSKITRLSTTRLCGRALCPGSAYTHFRFRYLNVPLTGLLGSLRLCCSLYIINKIYLIRFIAGVMSDWLPDEWSGRLPTKYASHKYNHIMTEFCTNNNSLVDGGLWGRQLSWIRPNGSSLIT